MERPIRRLVTCLVTAFLVPGAAHAQTTTADGVQAIVRGDYQTAVRILRALAEDTPEPDPLAQFFMAALYESGQGVARNGMRACGLYLNAATAANPLMSQSLDLARGIQEQFGSLGASLCDAASASRSSPAPPRTFTLAQDHSVTLDESGATVRYMGAEKHTAMGGGGGVVFLPIRHTPVDVVRPADTRRHFIQFFLWLPNRSSDPPTWTLGWILHEVVGLDVSHGRGRAGAGDNHRATAAGRIRRRQPRSGRCEREWRSGVDRVGRSKSAERYRSPQRASLMRTEIFAAILLFFAASPARAQPGTAEGVDAFLRGDYQRAADILKPIAEQSPEPDHIASFFMAALYESGRGVSPDPMRACASYLRASSGRGPFATQATALVMSRRAVLGREAFEECSWRASVGFDHGFEAVTFALGPGHWIAWDLKGATITYDGKEKRVQRPLASNRAVILPLRHTELAVGPTRSTRRHFIEILTWLPGRERQKWTLMWVLVEIVRTI